MADTAPHAPQPGAVSRVRSVAMKRSILALALVAVTVLGFATFHVGNAGAWKCDKHPEQPTCTTTTAPTTVPPSTVSTTTTPEITVPTTTTTVPVDLAPPVSIAKPPTPPRFAG